MDKNKILDILDQMDNEYYNSETHLITKGMLLGNLKKHIVELRKEVAKRDAGLPESIQSRNGLIRNYFKK